MRTIRNTALMLFVLSMLLGSSAQSQNRSAPQKDSSNNNVRVLWQFDSGG